jgi:hypothetical protein
MVTVTKGYALGQLLLGIVVGGLTFWLTWQFWTHERDIPGYLQKIQQAMVSFFEGVGNQPTKPNNTSL